MSDPQPEQQQVMAVHDVNIAILKSMPPQIVVSAIGTVSTGGWSEPQLVPYIYVKPPEDGIQDYDFVATPPSGYAIQVLLPVFGSYGPEEYPDWMVGARVHSASGAVETLFSDSREVAL